MQELKRKSGNVYYCILTNAAGPAVLKSKSAKFQNLFIGVFRVNDCAAFVIGQMAQRDGADFRMMMETLARSYTIPAVGKPSPTAPKQKIFL